MVLVKRTTPKPSPTQTLSPARPMCITNIVSLSTLRGSRPGETLELNILCKAIHGKFGKVFPAVVSRLRELQLTLSCFGTRVIVCTGARTREDSIVAHNMAAHAASKHLHRHYQATNFRVTNIVTSTALGYRLDMHSIDVHFAANGWTWRPIVFSGMKVEHRFRVNGVLFKATFIVFANGNINVTGLRKESHIPIVEAEMHRLFAPFRINEEESLSQEHKLSDSEH